MAFAPAIIAAMGSTTMGALATAAITAGGSMLAAKLSRPKTPSIPKPEAPPKPAQAAKSADRGAALAGNAAAAMPGGSMSGNSGTFLTGPGGVDSGTLNLGRNTLLGQ